MLETQGVADLVDGYADSWRVLKLDQELAAVAAAQPVRRVRARDLKLDIVGFAGPLLDAIDVLSV